jgi:hypothetical protein
MKKLIIILLFAAFSCENPKQDLEVRNWGNPSIEVGGEGMNIEALCVETYIKCHGLREWESFNSDEKTIVWKYTIDFNDYYINDDWDYKKLDTDLRKFSDYTTNRTFMLYLENPPSVLSRGHSQISKRKYFDLSKSTMVDLVFLTDRTKLKRA